MSTTATILLVRPIRERPIPWLQVPLCVRRGTTTLFAALDVATGAVIGKCSRHHRATEFLGFLKDVEAAVPEGLDVHLVMDNYATHRTEKVGAWLARRRHRHVHFTRT